MSRRKPFAYARASRPVKVAGRMNGTEKQYADILDIRKAAGEVVAYWYERHTLKLADDCRFTPDFWVLLSDGSMEVVEVKGGHIEDDAKVKLKVAADMFPYRFWLAQLLPKKRGGGWKIEEVKSETWTERAA